MNKEKKLDTLIEQLEIFSGKKVVFLENFKNIEIDVQLAAKALTSMMPEIMRTEAKNIARRYNLRQEAIEAMLKKDIVELINKF